MIDEQSKIIKVAVSNRVYVGGVSDAVQRLIIDAANIPNPFFERARKEGIWGEPKTIPVHQVWSDRTGGNGVSVPRGMLGQVCRGLDALGYDWAIDDMRVSIPLDRVGQPIDTGFLRDYQREAMEALIHAEQGIYEAPTGSGKTMTAIGLIATLMEPTLILVDRRHLVNQWSSRIEEIFRFRPATVVAGEILGPNQSIVVTTIQSLATENQAKLKLQVGRGLVILDECHHVTARTYRDLFDVLPARYRYGLSATPERQPGLLALAQAYLGPIVAKTSRKGLLERGLLVQPHVRPVETDFKFDYQPTYRDADGKLHRNNWGSLIKEVVADKVRNALIAETVASYVDDAQPRAQLVISRNKDHLRQLWMEVRDRVPVMTGTFMLTGEMSADEREKVIETVAQSPWNTVTFSTLADEALDCPRFDTIHLTYPTSSLSLLTQQVGRIVRPADKQPALILDYWDKNVPILNEQHMRRRRAFYIPEGMPLVL